MKKLVVFALVILASVTATMAFAAGTPHAPEAATRMLPFPVLVCLPNSSDKNPWCADNPESYSPPVPWTASRSGTVFGMTPQSTRMNLSRQFDAAFFSRRRIQERCLQAQPPRPPRAYRHDQHAGWSRDLSVTSKQPYFYVMQNTAHTNTNLTRQNSYRDYFYCVTHRGF